MLQGLKRQSWTCARCLRQLRQQQRRNGSTVTAAATSTLQPADGLKHPMLATHSAPGSQHDDKTLRQIFDSGPFWTDFSTRARTRGNGKRTGLFQNRYLTRPEGFQEFSNATLKKCRRIVSKVVAASSVEDYIAIAKDLDRLSDLICRIIDLSDFVRSTHPDRNIQVAANNAYVTMYEYMNVLNTTTELNDQLKKAVSMPEVQAAWTEEEKVVATILIRDFSRSAIEGSEDHRQRFVELSNEVSQVGAQFVDEMQPEKQYLNFSSNQLKGMEPQFLKQKTSWGQVTLPTAGMPALLAIRNVEDADVRREVYIANRTAWKKGINQLETLLTKRAELAKLSGYPSYAHLALSDKMAQTPDAVLNFLSALNENNRIRIKDENEELLNLKKSDARAGNFPDRLNAWDKEYYTARLLSHVRSKNRHPDFLPAYFSIGTVMQGLSRLFHRLYGIRFVPHETLPGETWSNEVRRLDVVDDVEGHIAVVYCDLFERPGKSPNPAHFTLRCSRLIQPSEVAEASAETPLDTTSLSSLSAHLNDGMATNLSPTTQNLYQLPTIALICDFSRAPAPRPTLLTFQEVKTLFHEMGHAVHSILGRTTLQNVSGTRCATDFAELPSVLMEHFATAPEVLGLFARHWETDKPLPYPMIQERLDVDRKIGGAEIESQVLLAVLDQRYHSLHADSLGGFDSTKVWQGVNAEFSSIPEPPSTRWQGFFGHLFGYGATYYSYLFDRVIAGKIWKDVFQSERHGGPGRAAVDGDAGGRFREEVLRWGGGRDGWRCVAGVLGDKRLEKGGEEAMRIVGSWGLKD